MSEIRCDRCSGLACGDECDGKSHVTLEPPAKRAKIMGAEELVQALRQRNNGHWAISRTAAMKLVEANFAMQMEARK